jgi:hypothetical protein
MGAWGQEGRTRDVGSNATFFNYPFLIRHQMKLAIQICAELEWKCTKSILKIRKNGLRDQPFRESGTLVKK